jgi:hypothetical protein
MYSAELCTQRMLSGSAAAAGEGADAGARPPEAHPIAIPQPTKTTATM